MKLLTRLDVMNWLKKFDNISTTDPSNLVNKANQDTKNGEQKINYQDHDRFITTQEFNKLTAENFVTRLKETKLVTKNCIVGFTKMTDFNGKGKKLYTKVTLNKTKYVEVTKNYMIYQEELG